MSDDLTTYLQNARTLLENKEFIEALKNYEKVLSVSSDHIEALFFKAVCLSTLDRTEESIETLDNIISIIPEDNELPKKANVFISRGLLHMKLFHMGSAIDDFTTTLELEPEHPIAILNLKAAYRLVAILN